MATREELVQGLEFTVQQAKRTTALFVEDEWDAKRDSGWTPRQVYCHLASTAAIVPQLGAGLMNAPENADISTGLNINDMNAQAVSAMEAMDPPQIMQAFEQNYAKLIDFVKQLPDEQLQAKRSFLAEPRPVSDILGNAIMLHGIHHVYEAAARPLPQ